MTEAPGSPNRELMSALGTLLEAGKYSDLTVVCGEKRYHAHRAILCSRSGFFDGACSSPFREAQTGEIDLSEEDPEAVEHMIQYFYHLDYLRAPKSRSRPTSRASLPTSPASPRSPTFPSSPFSRSRGSSFRRPRKLNLAMVEDPLLAQAAASSYQHYPLTPLDEEQVDSLHKRPQTPEELYDEESEEIDLFDAQFPDQDPNPAQPYLIAHSKVYALAEKYGIGGLKSLARKKFASQIAHHYNADEFSDACAEVYDTTVDSDRGLRDVIIQTFREHPELVHRKDVEAVVKVTPGLAWELFRVGWGLPVY